MMLVDAQVHIWGADSPARPWPAGGANAAHRPEPVGVAETLRVLDAAGVRRAVIVPPSWEGDHNDLALEAAERHPDRFAVMGRVPLDDLSVGRRLKAWRDQPGMLGVRLTMHREPWRTAFRRGELRWFWKAANDAGLPVMAYAPRMSAQLGVVARRYPDMRLVVDHMGLTLGLTGPEAFTDLPELLALARLPNVAVKASALPCHSRFGFPFTDTHLPLRQVFEAFGPHRLFWGSDWTRLPCPYRENLALFTEELTFLSGTDLRAVMGEAVLDWLAWPKH
jgi:L-fuconolactonase